MDCFEQQAPCYSSEPVYSPRTEQIQQNVQDEHQFYSIQWFYTSTIFLFIRRLASSPSMFVVIIESFFFHTQQTILKTPVTTVFAESPTKKYLLLLAFTQAGQPVLEVSLVHQKPLNFGTLYEARVISQHLYVQSKADKAGRRVLQTNPTLK